MRIIRHPIQTWEPAVIDFVATSANKMLLEDITRHVQDWLDQRDRLRPCKCSQKYFHARDTSPRRVRTSIQWICEICLPHLASQMAERLPLIRAMEVGLKPTATGQRDIRIFVRVPARTVQFEDGSRVFVENFEIRQSPITIAEFEQFTLSTGYLTDAERADCPSSFRDNFAANEFKVRERASLPANYLTFNDAEAFCRYHHTRLPTEAEFLAAALLDDKVYSEITNEMRQRLHIAQERGEAEFLAGKEFTSTAEVDGRIVVRGGPFYFLLRGWESSLKYHRQLVDRDYYSSSLRFRIIRPP